MKRVKRQEKSVYTAHRSITQFPDKNCQSINQPVNQTRKCDKGTQRAQNNSKGDFLSALFHFSPNHPLSLIRLFRLDQLFVRSRLTELNSQ